MELKYITKKQFDKDYKRFNRTFMELKFMTGEKLKTWLRGLIVPLWN